MKAITIKVTYRDIPAEALPAINEYISGHTSWVEAHNCLIPFGLNLKEDGTICDY